MSSGTCATSLVWQIVVKARSKYINVADKMCEFNDSFMLYMTTRLPNPHLSPENQAKVNLALAPRWQPHWSERNTRTTYLVFMTYLVWCCGGARCRQ